MLIFEPMSVRPNLSIASWDPCSRARPTPAPVSFPPLSPPPKPVATLLPALRETSHPVYDLPETGVHHLVEVLRCRDVYVVAENLRLRKFGKVIQHLLEQLGNVKPFGVHGVGRARVELFDGQASGVVLQQVID